MGDTTVVVPAEEGGAGTQSADFAAGVAAATAATAQQDAGEAVMTAEGAQDAAQAAIMAADQAAGAAYDAQTDVESLRSEVRAGFEAVTGALGAITERVTQAPVVEAATAPAPPTTAEKTAAEAEKTPATAEKKRRRGFGAWAT